MPYGAIRNTLQQAYQRCHSNQWYATGTTTGTTTDTIAWTDISRQPWIRKPLPIKLGLQQQLQVETDKWIGKL